MKPWTVFALIEGVIPATAGSPLQARDVPIRAGASAQIAVGTSAGEAYSAVPTTVAIDASDNTDLDLQSIASDGPLAWLDNSTLTGATEVTAILIHVKSANGAITITPGASNGWTGITGANGELVLSDGEFVLLKATKAISGAAKVLNFANAGAAAAEVTVVFLN